MVDRRSIPLDRHKIKRLRESAGLSQVELARRAGQTSSQIISDIERGRRTNITIATLDRIAAALGVSAKDLLK
jgi:transcriptional regulator with XRE-family HTH domain